VFLWGFVLIGIAFLSVGMGFSAGLTYITQGIPLPVPAMGTRRSTTKSIYILI
jgi:hypothetical protein